MEIIRWKVPTARCIVRGTEIAQWEGPGRPPDAATLVQWAADFQSQNIAGQQQRDRDLSMRAIKALSVAIHKRFKLIPADTVTAAQWQRAIETEWDGLS